MAQTTHHLAHLLCVLSLCSFGCDDDKDKDEAPAPAAVVEPTSSAGAAPAPPPSNEWVDARKSLQLRRHSAPGVDAIVARFSLDDFELVSAPATLLQDTTRATLRQLGERVPYVVGVNGGFFDRDDSSMGLRVTRNRLLGTPRKADWGVFYTTSEGVFLEHTKEVDLRRVQHARFAIQCGPRIITAGQPQKLKPGQHHRTVLGFDERGRISVVATRTAVDLNTLAANLLRSEAEGGLGLVEALALDGGPSTGFISNLQDAPTEKSDPNIVDVTDPWQLPVGTPVADAVFVVPRGASLWLDDLTDMTRLGADLLRGFGDVP